MRRITKFWQNRETKDKIARRLATQTSPWHTTFTVPSFASSQDAVDLLVVLSDLHVNHTCGLRTPVFNRFDGRNDVAQDWLVKYLWEPWVRHWSDVRAELKRLKKIHKIVRLIVLLNGDGPDKNVHDPMGYELISNDEAEIIDMTMAVLHPMYELADKIIVNRGTRAHERNMSELVARELDNRTNGKIVRKTENMFTHYAPRFVLQNVDIIAGHHPLSGSRRVHTRNQAAARTAFDLYSSFVGIGEKPPDLALFAHNHIRADSGSNDKCPMRALYSPSWTLPGSYVYRLGLGHVPEKVGTWWIKCAEGEFVHKAWNYQPPVQEAIKI